MSVCRYLSWMARKCLNTPDLTFFTKIERIRRRKCRKKNSFPSPRTAFEDSQNICGHDFMESANPIFKTRLSRWTGHERGIFQRCWREAHPISDHQHCSVQNISTARSKTHQTFYDLNREAPCVMRAGWEYWAHPRKSVKLFLLPLLFARQSVSYGPFLYWTNTLVVRALRNRS